MLLEKMKFLEKSARIACEEAIEEVDAILEGADPKTSSRLIKTILEDFLNTLDHIDSIEVDDVFEFAELSEKIPFEDEILLGKVYLDDFLLGKYESLFMPGDQVKILHLDTVSESNFSSEMGFPKKTEFYGRKEASIGMITTILKVIPHPVTSRPLYAAKAYGKLFFLSVHSMLEKI